MKRPFIKLDAVAAPLPLANIDTDQLVPARYLKTISRSGLGRWLLQPMRQDQHFVLNLTPWDQAEILIALDNFGCGSSREHAPWALLDFGIKCIIATSFADIFANNCLKNGILTIKAEPDIVGELLTIVADPANARLRIDLPNQRIEASGGRDWQFQISAQDKQDLLLGTDEIARTLLLSDKIEAFEAARQSEQPWLNFTPESF